MSQYHIHAVYSRRGRNYSVACVYTADRPADKDKVDRIVKKKCNIGADSELITYTYRRLGKKMIDVPLSTLTLD